MMHPEPLHARLIRAFPAIPWTAPEVEPDTSPVAAYALALEMAEAVTPTGTITVTRLSYPEYRAEFTHARLEDRPISADVEWRRDHSDPAQAVRLLLRSKLTRCAPALDRARTDLAPIRAWEMIEGGGWVVMGVVCGFAVAALLKPAEPIARIAAALLIASSVSVTLGLYAIARMRDSRHRTYADRMMAAEVMRAALPPVAPPPPSASAGELALADTP